MRRRHVIIALLAAAVLAGCGQSYSPDTYATRAVQQANKVEPGVIVGVRAVAITAEGSTGAAAGAAAGGVIGAQAPGGGIGAALGGVGGALVGGLIGKATEHATVDALAWEYVVRTPKGELLSVTQRERTPMEVGTRVLVITGAQARIVADYTVPEAAGVAAARSTTPTPAPSPTAATPPPAPLLPPEAAALLPPGAGLPAYAGAAASAIDPMGLPLPAR